MTSFDKHVTHPHKFVLNSIQKQLDYVATCLRKEKNNMHLFYIRALRHCTWKNYKFALYSLWCFQRMAEVQQREFFEIEGPKSDVAYPLKVRYCGGIRLFIVLRILMLSYKYIMIYKYIKYLL